MCIPFCLCYNRTNVKILKKITILFLLQHRIFLTEFAKTCLMLKIYL